MVIEKIWQLLNYEKASKWRLCQTVKMVFRRKKKLLSISSELSINDAQKDKYLTIFVLHKTGLMGSLR